MTPKVQRGEVLGSGATMHKITKLWQFNTNLTCFLYMLKQRTIKEQKQKHMCLF